MLHAFLCCKVEANMGSWLSNDNWVFKGFNLEKQGIAHFSTWSFSMNTSNPTNQKRKGKADFSKFSRELSPAKRAQSDRSWHWPKLNIRQRTFNKNIWGYQRISRASPDSKAQWEKSSVSRVRHCQPARKWTCWALPRWENAATARCATAICVQNNSKIKDKALNNLKR